MLLGCDSLSEPSKRIIPRSTGFTRLNKPNELHSTKSFRNRVLQGSRGAIGREIKLGKCTCSVSANELDYLIHVGIGAVIKKDYTIRAKELTDVMEVHEYVFKQMRSVDVSQVALPTLRN